MNMEIPYSKLLPVDLVEAGFRASEAITRAIARAGGWWDVRNRWMGIRLSDGYCDGIIFDRRNECIKYYCNKDPHFYLGLRNLAGGAHPRELSVVIKFARDAHEAGFRYTDPDDAASRYQVAMTAGQRDYLRRTVG